MNSKFLDTIDYILWIAHECSWSKPDNTMYEIRKANKSLSQHPMLDFYRRTKLYTSILVEMLWKRNRKVQNVAHYVFMCVSV